MGTFFEDSGRFLNLAGTLQNPALSPALRPWLSYRPGDMQTFNDLVAWRKPRLTAWTVPSNHLRILFLNCLEFLDSGTFLELWSTVAATLDMPPANLINDLFASRMVEIGLQECQGVFEFFERFIGNPAAGKLLDCMVNSPQDVQPGAKYPVPGMAGLAAKWFDRFFDDRMDPREVAMEILMDFCVTYGIPKSISLSRRLQAEDAGIHMQFLFAPDPMLQVPVWYDHLLYDARLVAMQIGAFGLPMAPGFRVLFDCRPMEYALRDLDWEVVDGLVLLDGVELGRIKPFHPSCAELEWDLGGIPIPDVRVVEATRDLHCPSTGRIIWRRGTLYGTPFYISEIRFPPMSIEELRDFRQRLSMARKPGPAQDQGPTVPDIDRKFGAAMERLSGKAEVFRYRRDSDHIFLGPEKFARGPVARILVRMLRDHTVSGATEFANVDLKHDPFVLDNPKASCFETYLKRLQNRLLARSCNVKLDLGQRGMARLSRLGPARLEEE